MPTPARQRPTIAVRLEPTSYEKIVALADAAHISVTAQTERMLEKALEPNFAGSSARSIRGARDGGVSDGRSAGRRARSPVSRTDQRPGSLRTRGGPRHSGAVVLASEALCDLRDAAATRSGCCGARIALSANPADAGKLHFITPDENKNED